MKRLLLLLCLATGTAPRVLCSQTLKGRVFVDKNANGTQDQHESGLARVAVSNQDTVVLTDASGTYHLPAAYGTDLVFVSVPDGYRTTGSFWLRATERLEFPLVGVRHRDAAVARGSGSPAVRPRHVSRLLRARLLLVHAWRC